MVWEGAVVAEEAPDNTTTVLLPAVPDVVFTMPLAVGRTVIVVPMLAAAVPVFEVISISVVGAVAGDTIADSAERASAGAEDTGGLSDSSVLRATALLRSINCQDTNMTKVYER